MAIPNFKELIPVWRAKEQALLKELKDEGHGILHPIHDRIEKIRRSIKDAEAALIAAPVALTKLMQKRLDNPPVPKRAAEAVAPIAPPPNLVMVETPHEVESAPIETTESDVKSPAEHAD